MPNEEVLGPRKTMFVLVIVVGCFAVLWPRILSPLILGTSRDQLKPNAFDREAGCCEVMFETELAVLELINEVCSSAGHADGKLSPYAAVECRKAVNETCGVDIAAFLKRTENIGKTSKKLVETMKNSNSSCLKEHFGVPVWSLGPHQALNSWTLQDTVKQERPSTRGGPHPALRERGRAIPPGATPSRPVTAMPPHVRPPPIPGMRPPLGSPGGPVPAPKSSMGFVMPIYTICIIVFFVYTLSKILFKRTASPYEPVSPDPQFRRRVFRDDSRTSPDKLGPKERDTRDVELEALRARLAETELTMQRIVVVTAISGLVAEVQQQMDATHAQNQQRQEAQDDHARPYTNGTILHNTGPVHIVTSEYREASKEKSPEPQNVKPESVPEVKESSSEKATKESLETQDELSVKKESDEVPKISQTEQSKSKTDGDQQKIPEGNDLILSTDVEDEKVSHEAVPSESGSEPELIEIDNKEDELMRLTSDIDESDGYVKVVQDFLNEESKAVKEDKQSTLDLLEEAIKEDLADKIEDDQENASVKVVGMEVTAHTVDGGAVPRAPPPALHTPAPHRPHEAEEVKSIYLETEIPQKSRVLVTDFAEDRPEDSAPASSSPMVVSGKMTLSLIQDAPRDTPERDPESTVDDFTTASAITQPALDKQAEESEEEIEIEEEIVEIVEDEEIEEIEQDEEDIPLVSKPVKVVEEIKVTEPVQVTESVKEEMVGAVADDSKDIEELVEVTEPVKWSEEIDVEEEITEVDVKDELFQVSDPEKASAPAEEIQELEVEDKAAKVTEQLKWSEEASVEDSKEIEEFENEPVETSNTVKEAAPEEVLEELEVENEPIRVTEISKWPEEAGAEEEVQELEIEDTPVKETESLKWSEEADTKDSEEHEEQGNKLIEVTKSLKEADPDEEVEELEIEDKTVNGVESLKLSKEAATNDSEEIEVHDQLIKVTEPVKEAAPVQEVQELEIEDKPVKVVESLKWSDEAATNDSEEIVERDNELINVTEPVEEAVPIEDVKNEPVKPTEPMKWSEQVAAEVSEEIELYDDERAQIVEPIKEPQKEQEKAEVQEFEIKDKLVKVTEPEKSSEKSSPKEEAQALELKDEQVTVVPEPIKWSEEVAAEDTEDAINKVPVKLTESLKSSTDAATEEETQEGQGNEAAKVTETVKPKKKGKKKKSGGKERNNVAKGSKE